MRSLVLRTHKEIVAQLTEHALNYDASIGLNGRKFKPGRFPQFVVLKFKVGCSPAGGEFLVVREIGKECGRKITLIMA